MRTLSSLALLTLMACPGPVVDDPDRPPAPDGGVEAPSDGGVEAPIDGGQAAGDAGASPVVDAGGGGVRPDTGVAAPDGGAEPEPELSDVFIDNPLGTYEILDLWIDEEGEEAPAFEGLVFADSGATAMMADLSECLPMFVFAEWRLNGEGQLLTYESPDDDEGDLLLGAVAPNGTMTIQFPGGGAVLRRVRTDCHTMESHLGTWQIPGDERNAEQTVVLTEEEEYVVMLSVDPCFPLTTATYDLAGPWLRLAEGDEGLGDSIPIFTKRDRLIMGGIGGGDEDGTPAFERIDRCEDGVMSPPPAALAGTYRASGANVPAPFMALSADGQFTLLTSVTPCAAASSGQYTANNTVFGYRVGDQMGMGRYTMEGANVTVYQGVDAQAPVWLNLTRVRSDCH